MEEQESILVLHGLGRTSAMMRPMEKYLASHHFEVFNHGYPSRQHSIEHLTRHHLHNILEKEQIQQAKTLHLVTHSMSSIMLRYYLNHNTIKNLGRVVMIAPPNKGSEIAQFLRPWRFYKKIWGPAGQQLGTDKTHSIPLQLGSLHIDFGVITGNRNWNLLSSLLFRGKNDGKVSVESAKLAGMKDFLVLPCNHSQLVHDKRTFDHVLHFIRFGHFQK